MSGDRYARNALPRLPKPWVADEYDIGVLRITGFIKQFGDKLGADPGRVAQREGDSGFLF